MAARRVSQASMQNIFSGFLPAEVVNSVAAAPVDTTTASETDILFTTAQASAEAGLQLVIEELERSFEVVGFEVDAETFADECDMEKIIATLVGESLAAAHAALSTGGTVDISGLTTELPRLPIRRLPYRCLSPHGRRPLQCSRCIGPLLSDMLRLPARSLQDSDT